MVQITILGRVEWLGWVGGLGRLGLAAGQMLTGVVASLFADNENIQKSVLVFGISPNCCKSRDMTIPPVLAAEWDSDIGPGGG